MKGQKLGGILLVVCLLAAFLPARAEEAFYPAAMEQTENLPAPNQNLQTLADDMARETEPQTITIAEDNTVLDLQGRTVIGPAGAPAILVSAKNVTIQNGRVQGGAGTAEKSAGTGIQCEAADLTLGSGLVVIGGSGAPADENKGAGNGGAAVEVRSQSVIIAGAVLTGGAAGTGSEQYPQAGNGAPALELKGGAVEIRTGTLTGGGGYTGGHGAQTAAGTSLAIGAGTVTGGAGTMTGGHAVVFAGNNLAVQGGVLTGGASSGGIGGTGLAVLNGAPGVVLTGGSFAGGAGVTAGNAVSTTGTLGTLLGEISSYQPVSGDDPINGDASFSIQPVRVITALAYIGSKPYTDFSLALAEVQDGQTIELTQDIQLDQAVFVTGKAVILTGKNHLIPTLSRKQGYQESLVLVGSDGSLTLQGVILDGGAVWGNSALPLGRPNNGASAQSPLARMTGGVLRLESGTILQNNDNIKAEKPAAGGVLANGGTLVLTGDAAIRDNRAAANAGGVYLADAALQMEGTSAITGNTASGNAQAVMSCVGGVQAVSTSRISLSGSASISGNTGTGGGVTLSDNAVLAVSGAGSISGNRAVLVTLAGKPVHTGGGISAEQPRSVQVEGAAVIFGNTLTNAAGTQISASNLLYLEPSSDAEAVVAVTGTLDTAAKIGIGRYRLDAGINFVSVPGAVAVFPSGTESAAGQARFVCDDDGYRVWKDGAALAVKPVVSYVLTGVVTRDGNPVAGAKIELKQGAAVAASAVTAADGSYGIEAIDPGIYNLAASLSDGTLIVTSKVQITSGTSRLDVALPGINTSSGVDIQTGTAIIVGGLDEMFSAQLVGSNSNSADGVTQQDLAAAQSGGAVKLIFTAAPGSDQSAGGQTLIGLIDPHSRFQRELLLDLRLQKQTTENATTTVTQVSRLPKVLEIRIPMPDAMQQMEGAPVAYRVKGSGLQAITTKKNADGESLTVEGKTLVLQVRAFSLYAIGWEKAAGSSGNSSEEEPTFEERQDAFWEDVALKIKQAKSGETITVDAGGFTNMNWRVMSALRDHPGVALKVRWDGGKTFLIPAGKAQKDNGLSNYSLYRLAEIYTAASSEQSSIAASSSAPTVRPSVSSSAAIPSSSSSSAASTISSSEESSAIEEIPTEPSEPDPQEDLFHISVGVVLAGAGVITALIIGVWAIVSYRRRQKEIE
ncbi:MAG: carboxypeptidase-like regulatory domain-containing protein [Oscillospiraceae bacterium]|nr:carboxypeptidase-like regulatory domain-containing protein [Oscillospiraceae bacterium]